MTAKEQRAMRQLEIRAQELQHRLDTTATIYREHLFELVETRTALRASYEALIDAENILYELMKNDPAFMHEFPQPFRMPSRGLKQVNPGF